MKITYSKIMLLTVSAAVIAVGLFIFRPKEDTITSEPAQSVQQKQEQPVQATETLQESVNSRELAKEAVPEQIQIPPQPQTPVVQEAVERDKGDILLFGL